MNMMHKKRTYTHTREKMGNDENGNDFIHKSKEERIESELWIKIEDSFEEKKCSFFATG